MTAALADAHVHLLDERYGMEPALVLDRARRAGVGRWLACTVDIVDWTAVRTACAALPGVRTAFGIHPWRAASHDGGPLPACLIDEIRAGATAIGEIGLDGHCAVSPAIQLPVFRRLLALAVDLDLPACVHAREAWETLLPELESLPVRGMVHNYTGGPEIVERLAGRGWYFSFGGVATRRHAPRIERAIRAVPLERILVETDAPDLAPVGVAGPNLPEYLPLVLHAVAEKRDMDARDLAAATWRNFHALFGRHDG